MNYLMLSKSLQAQSPFHKEQVIRKALIFEEEKLQANDLGREGRGDSLPILP